MNIKTSIYSFCHKNNSTCFIDRFTILGKTYDWSSCARYHDVAYVKQDISRKEADKKLYNCVKEKCKVVAPIMYIGVRVFGWYFWNKAKGKSDK